MATIITDDDFARAASVWREANPGGFQGTPFVWTRRRKIYDEVPDPALDAPVGKVISTDVTPAQEVLDAALDASNAQMAAAEQRQQTLLATKTTVLSDFDASLLKNKTPAQIQSVVQSEIDAWASLADARNDLRVWLPLMAKAIAYLLEREHP